MKRDRNKFSTQRIILYAFGGAMVIWIGMLIAPSLENGLQSLISDFGTIMENPFHIVWCSGSLKTVLILFLLYGIALAVFLSSERNYRKREEHGSAKWGTSAQLNRKYASAKTNENVILTQNVSIGMDGRKHRRNLNVLVCGGSGSGKTRFYAKPNIMNANCSMVIIDAKYYKQSLANNMGSRMVHSNNLYQIYAYVKNEDKNHTGKVSGMLLYAQTTEDVLPMLSVPIGGNQISARTLDLNRDFKEISASLDLIARKAFGEELNRIA